MLLFLSAANKKYAGILAKCIKTPMHVIFQQEEDGILIPHRTFPKEPSEYTDEENEQVTLDINLQLFLVETQDLIMYNNVVNCQNANQIWDTLEIICEGSEEVRENRLEILNVQFKQFGANLGEGVSEVFIKYNNLINNLNLNGRWPKNKEINLKFLLTPPENTDICKSYH